MPKAYRRISSEARQQIIEFFTIYGLNAKQVSEQSGHKLSSVKAVYKVFKKEGRVARKTKRDIIHQQVHSIFVFEYEDDLDLSLKDSLKMASSSVTSLERIESQAALPKRIEQIVEKYQSFLQYDECSSGFELLETSLIDNPSLQEKIRFYLTATKQELLRAELDKIYEEIEQLK